MPAEVWHWSGYAVALAAFVGVLWALVWDRPRGRKRCRRCWYDMSGVGDLPASCPECGRAHAKAKDLTRTRRRWWRAAALFFAMVVGGYGLWVVPRVQEQGWVGVVPTSALIAFAPVIQAAEGSPGASGRHAAFRGATYGSELRRRCYDMPKVLGGVAYRWFGAWSPEPVGQHDEPRLVQWCREELVVQSNLPEAMLRRVVHSAVGQRLIDVPLVGRMDTRGDRIWLEHPRQQAWSNRGIVIPRGWRLDWRMLRADGVSPRYTMISGSGGWATGGNPDSEDPLADFDPVWQEGVEVRYQIRVREPDFRVTRKWIVAYRPGVLESYAELDVQSWEADPIAVEVVD